VTTPPRPRGRHSGPPQDQGGQQPHRPSEPHFTQSMPPPAGYERAPGLPQQPRGLTPQPQQAPPKAKPKGNTRAGCILLLGIAVVIAVVVVVLTNHSGPSASFRAGVADYTVIDPADLAVTIKVTNTGGAAGTPDCTVQASDPSGADSGINEGTLSSPVRPGQTVTTVMNLTITHQSAQYVSQASVTCTG